MDLFDMFTGPAITRYFKGGGGGGGSNAQPARSIAPPAAPPSATSVEVSQAGRDQRKQAAKRRGMRSTVLAGETGGYEPGQKATVLGNVGGGG